MRSESPSEQTAVVPTGLPYTTQHPEWPLPESTVVPQACPCAGGGEVGVAAAGSPVYAYGTIEAYFPSLTVEKEFYQAIDLNTLSQGDKDAFSVGDTVDLWRINQLAQSSTTLFQVLSHLDNRPIAREMCWSLRGLDEQRRWSIYPRDDKELGHLIAALQIGSEGAKQAQVLVGQAESIAIGSSPPPCGGDLPVATITHLFGRSQDNIVEDLKKQAKCANVTPDNLSSLVGDMLALAKNAGAGAAKRAVNFVVLNDLDLYCLCYGLVYDAKPPNPNGFQIIEALTLSKPIADGRELVDVVLAFQGTDTGTVQRWARSVDVTGVFPFVAGEWARFLG